MQLVRFCDLRNGFRIYSQCDRISHLGGIGVRVGTSYDSRNKTGIIHLGEHVRSRGTKKYPSSMVDLMVQKYMGGLEGDINVRVDRSSTFFGNAGLIRKRYMLACFDMWMDLVRNTEFDQEALDIEKSAIHNEHYEKGRNVVESELYDLIHLAVFGNTVASRRIDCEPCELEKITVGMLKQTYNRYFRAPRNLFALTLGPSLQETRELVKPYFGDLEDVGIPNNDIDIDGVPAMLTAPLRWEIDNPGIKQWYVAVGFPVERYGSDDDEVMDAIAQIVELRLLGLREGNRDFNKGIYHPHVHVERHFTHGIMFFYFSTISREYAEYGEEFICRELAQLRENLVSVEEFDAATFRIRTEYLEAFEKVPDTLAELVINAACNGDEDLVRLHSVRERIDRMTRVKLRNVANRIFTLPNYACAVIRPV